MNTLRVRRAAGVLTSLAILGPALAVLTTAGPAFGAGSAFRAGSPAGTITTVAGSLGGPGQVQTVGISPCAVTYSGGSLYATDVLSTPIMSDAAVIRKISMSTGALTTPAGNGTAPTVFEGFAPPEPDVPDGSPATSAELTPSCGVAVDSHGNLLISGGTNYEDGASEGLASGIRVVAASTGTFYGRSMHRGAIYTIVAPANPVFRRVGLHPGALALDQAGNVLFTTDADRVYALARRSGTFYGKSMSKGKVYVVAGGGHSLQNGAAATTASLDLDVEHLNGFLDSGIRIDHHGNLVIADQGDCLVRVVAGQSGPFYGQAMRVGHIYTIAGNGTCRRSLTPPSPGRVLATKSQLGAVAGIAVDHAGNVVVIGGDWIEVVATATGRFYGAAMRKGHAYRIAGDGSANLGNGGPLSGPA